uniref:Uncharacterized protein n=1 Tax=Arundo donax TaxID=35708 RepID=A0A0A8XZ84_ARUDO
MLSAAAYQDHLEGAGVATTVHVALVSGSAKDCPTMNVISLATERPGKGHAALLAGDGIPHQEVELLAVDDKDAAMAAAEDVAVHRVVNLQGDSRGRYAVRRIQRGIEYNFLAGVVFGEEA